MRRLSQMPLVLLPLHFDRDPLQHVPSCQHSVVIRSFVTNDFMTGTAAQPGVQISEQVRGGLSRTSLQIRHVELHFIMTIYQLSNFCSINTNYLI